MSAPVIWQRLRRFRSLSRNEQRLFFQAIALLPLLSASFRVIGFLRTQRALQVLIHKGMPRQSTVEGRTILVGVTLHMVQAAAEYGIGRPTCLERSLVLWWLLGRQGIPAQMRIGARKVQGKFEAHAWVECGGLNVGEPVEPHRHFEAFQTAFPNGISEVP